MNGEILVRERRILTTRWVANSWSYICSNKDIVKRGFKKCGINVALDGSENSLVNIEGLPDYKVPSIGDLSQEYTLEDSDESDSNDSDGDPPAKNIESDSDEANEESDSEETDEANEDFGNDQVVVVRRPAFLDF